MRRQQQVWLKEHSSNDAIPALANSTPSGGVVAFIDFLKTNADLGGRAVDLGSGKGRNSIYLAQVGYDVIGMEYIQPAIDVSEQLAKANRVEGRVRFINAAIDEKWPFEDNCFSIAIDSFSSIDIETPKGREMCRDEMYRTLRPGGFALITVRAADDEWESELMAKHPGAEPNSTIWPQNGKFQKNYDEQELADFYGEFKIVKLEKIRKPAFLLGRDGIATNLWLVLQKQGPE